MSESNPVEVPVVEPLIVHTNPETPAIASVVPVRENVTPFHSAIV